MAGAGTKARARKTQRRNLAKVRHALRAKKAWRTRRKLYGPKGHS